MIKTCAGVFLVVALLGCNSDPAPGASVALDVTLDNSALTRMQNVSLIRTGDTFMLAGYENGQISWGQLSLAGKVTLQPDFKLPQPVVGPAPVFAATKKNTPGDQFIAIFVTNSATNPGGYALQAIVQTLGAPSPAAPVVLDDRADQLGADIDPNTVQIVAGAETSGNLGFVAWGIAVAGRTVNYRMLAADAAITGVPMELYDHTRPQDVPPWQCLTTANSASGLSFGVVIPISDPKSGLSASEFDTVVLDQNGGTSTGPYPLATTVENCRIVGSPAPAVVSSPDGAVVSEDGYSMAFEASSSIGFATYMPPYSSLAPDGGSEPTGNVTTQTLALPAASFGGPINMPRPAWISSAGSDVSIGVSRAAGPQVFRFAYNAVPHGGTLTLRSEQGLTGPVSAWVDSASDAVYVTYADNTIGSDGKPVIKRYFMSIQSPVTLP